MGPVETMTVVIPSEIADILREAVAKGEYTSENEAIGDALAGWRLQREAPDLDVETLRRLWDEGIASGEPQDADKFFAELLASLDSDGKGDSTRRRA